MQQRIHACNHHHRLIRLVETPSEDVVVQERQVVRGDVEVSVGQGDERGAVDDRLVLLVGVLKHGSSGLVSETSVLARDVQGGVGDVELVDESDKGGLSRVDQSADRGVVAVVVRDGLSGRFPAELDLASRLGQRGSVVGDGGVVAVDKEAWLIGDRQPGEDGPFDSRVLRRARDNVSGEQGPSHGLRDTRLKVDGERVSARELSEGHLLSGLGGDRLSEQSGGISSIEVGEEAVDTRLAPSGESLAKVDKVSDIVEIVLVLALQSGGVASVLDDVGEQLSVADFLKSQSSDPCWQMTWRGKVRFETPT
jgi:hypothetical protein